MAESAAILGGSRQMPPEPKANLLLVGDNPANLLSLPALLDADRRRTEEAGFDHHLVKPPDPQAVPGLLAALPK